jgi:hypothetical protein
MRVPVYDPNYQNTDAFNASNHLFSDTTGAMDSTTVADALLEAYNHGGDIDSDTVMLKSVYDPQSLSADIFDAENILFSDTTGEMDSTTVADALLEAFLNTGTAGGSFSGDASDITSGYLSQSVGGLGTDVSDMTGLLYINVSDTAASVIAVGTESSSVPLNSDLTAVYAGMDTALLRDGSNTLQSDTFLQADSALGGAAVDMMKVNDQDAVEFGTDISFDQTVIQGDSGTGSHTVDIMDYDAGTSHASGQVLQYRFCMGGSPVLSIRCEADGAGGINESSLGVYFDNTSLHVSYSPDYQDTDYTAVSLTELNTLRSEVYRNQTAIAAMIDSLRLTA